MSINISQELDSIVTNESVLFFDMDGTLIDTNYANFLAYKKAFEFVRKKDFNVTYSHAYRFNRSSLKKYIPELTDTELSLIILEKEKYYDDFLPKTQLNINIAEVLFKYSKTNQTILVTNCRKNRALATLNYHRLTDKFSRFFFRHLDSNIRINKFQNAIYSLSISPKLVIAFENENSEIADAIKAGIQYINPII